MAEPFGPDGRPREALIELSESSGPVSPGFQYSLRIRIEADTAGIHLALHRRDADGIQDRTGELGREAYTALWAALEEALPLGTHLDLAEALRDRKGISFNHVAVALSGAEARLDYVLTQLDLATGDSRARAVVGAVKAAAGIDPALP